MTLGLVTVDATLVDGHSVSVPLFLYHRQGAHGSGTIVRVCRENVCSPGPGGCGFTYVERAGYGKEEGWSSRRARLHAPHLSMRVAKSTYFMIPLL